MLVRMPISGERLRTCSQRIQTLCLSASLQVSPALFWASATSRLSSTSKAFTVGPESLAYSTTSSRRRRTCHRRGGTGHSAQAQGVYFQTAGALFHLGTTPHYRGALL